MIYKKNYIYKKKRIKVSNYIDSYKIKLSKKVIKYDFQKAFSLNDQFKIKNLFKSEKFFLINKDTNKNSKIIIDYKKIIDLKLHFLNMYYLGKKTYISKRQIFFFTSPSLIFNMGFFYQYQFEKWILQLIFLRINTVKWLKVYFLKNLNMGENVSLFFNLKNFFLTNIIKPTLYTYKIYKLLIIRSKKNKNKETIKYFSRIILNYFSKLFYSAYSLVFSKFNLTMVDKNIQNFLNLIHRSVRFELIRANFIFEFINICCLTFFSKDPKFLIKWLVKVLHKINFKKHWKFLYLFKYNILKILRKFINKSDLLGFHMTIRGKIGATGSVRKKTIHIQHGQYSFSRYYTSGDIYYLTSKTQTGIIGMKIIITYK